jgi:titin
MINLSWVTPVYTGGAAIVGYQITENRAGAGDVVIVSNTGSTATTYARTGLDRAVSHTYSVKAINSAGVGAASNTAVLTTAAELPGPPTGLTLTAGSPAMTVISLSWTAPTETGGAAISGYRIKKNGSIVVADTGTTATTYSATGLTAGATYTFAVAAINSAGAGGDSNVPSLTTSGS